METRALGVRRGAWTKEEDMLLKKCIEKHGEGRWHQVPLLAGLNRCRKSCRLRWLNYLKPNIKRGKFTVDETDLIIRLHNLLGNRWSLIAARLPGRTANDIKNYWNTNLRKKVASHKDQDEKSKQKLITKANIWKPRPRSFKNPCQLNENRIPIINNDAGGAQFGEDICQLSKTVFPSSIDIEGESRWWECLLEDKEINPTNNNNRLLGSELDQQESIKNTVLEEEKTAGTKLDGDTCFEQVQSWSEMAFDADLLNLMGIGQDHQGVELEGL